MPGCNAGIVERLKYLQACEYTVDAVVFATTGLRVEVAAGDHRCQGIIAAGSAHKDVADLVDTELTARGPAPADKQVTSGPVFISQGLAVTATCGGGAVDIQSARLNT